MKEFFNESDLEQVLVQRLKDLGGILGKAFPEIMAVYLFGSVPKGKARSDSDLDLLVVIAPERFDEQVKRIRDRGDAEIYEKDEDVAWRQLMYTYLFSLPAEERGERRIGTRRIDLQLDTTDGKKVVSGHSLLSEAQKDGVLLWQREKILQESNT